VLDEEMQHIGCLVPSLIVLDEEMQHIGCLVPSLSVLDERVDQGRMRMSCGRLSSPCLTSVL